MNLRLVYFAWCKEKVGCAQESVVVPDSVKTVSDLKEWLSSRGDAYADVFAQAETVRSAVNYEHVGGDFALTMGDEVAFFPPVTGG